VPIDFYDLCLAAESAAYKGCAQEAADRLREAKAIVDKEVGLARIRLEPTTAAIYTEVLWGSARSCGAHLGLSTAAPIGVGLFGYSTGTGVQRPYSSLNHRWKMAEIPETYLPFAWPKFYGSPFGPDGLKDTLAHALQPLGGLLHHRHGKPPARLDDDDVADRHPDNPHVRVVRDLDEAEVSLGADSPHGGKEAGYLLHTP